MQLVHGAPDARLLLIDDDPVVLQTLSHGLQTSGYQVVTAADPHQALWEYRRQPPDLVVLDIGLPDMSGTELAVAMLEQLYRPILILSGHHEAAHVREAIRSGVMGYLVKPVGPDQLIPSIETARARFADLRERISERWRSDAATDAAPIPSLLDQLAFGLMVIDRHYNIVLQNRVARRVLASRSSVLGNRRGKLVALATGCHASLDRALRQGLGVGCAPQTGVLTLPAWPAESRPYHVFIAPFIDTTSLDRRPAYATVIITDPHAPIAAPAHILKALYGLTTKESRLAQALLNGDTLKSFCAARCVSANTARTQLKAIYQKTGTHRQADLVRTLSKLFGNLVFRASTEPS